MVRDNEHSEEPGDLDSALAEAEQDVDEPIHPDDLDESDDDARP